MTRIRGEFVHLWLIYIVFRDRLVNFGGNGVRHIWLFWNRNWWASLWSPPNPIQEPDQPLLDLLRPFFMQQDRLADLSPLEAFAQLWRRIVADEPILDEVLQRV